MKVEHELLLRATQPERFAQLEEAGELTAIQVMRANMEFFHYRAAEVLATIMAMPLGDDVDATQLQALQDFAGVIKMRELAQQCARDLARYVHAPIAPNAPAPIQRSGNARPVAHPTPKAVSDAFARIAGAGRASMVGPFGNERNE